MNKAALRTQFKNLLNRNDCSNNLADTFLDQALGRIQRTLRVPSMEKVNTITFSDSLPSSFILPDDFLEFISLYFDGPSGGGRLTYVPMGTFVEIPKNTGGTPKYFTRIGAEVKVKPLPSQDTSLTLLYYGEIPDFTDDTSSNFLSEIAPDLLIYGALSYAADYFVDERKQAFEEVYARTFSDLVAQSASLEFSGGEMSIQPMYNIDY